MGIWPIPRKENNKCKGPEGYSSCLAEEKWKW